MASAWLTSASEWVVPLRMVATKIGGRAVRGKFMARLFEKIKFSQSQPNPACSRQCHEIASRRYGKRCLARSSAKPASPADDSGESAAPAHSAAAAAAAKGPRLDEGRDRV